MTSGTPTRMAAWLESAWLARYLDRQLEGEELAWFEGYLLDKPELVGAVEVDNSLRDALESLRDNPASPKRGDRNEEVAHRIPHRWIGLAACLLAGVGLGRYAVIGGSSKDSLIANPTRIVVDTFRGSDVAPVVDFAHGESSYVLVEISVPPEADHVRLVHAGNEIVLTPSHDGFAGFLLERAALTADPNVTFKYMQDGRESTRELNLSTKGASR